jgi:predicted DNA-binding transcriptional regulator AlpA
MRTREHKTRQTAGPVRGAAIPGDVDRILRRAEVAGLFSVSRATIDRWAALGLLTRVRLRGRCRAIGFRAREIAGLIG